MHGGTHHCLIQRLPLELVQGKGQKALLSLESACACILACSEPQMNKGVVGFFMKLKQT